MQAVTISCLLFQSSYFYDSMSEVIFLYFGTCIKLSIMMQLQNNSKQRLVQRYNSAILRKSALSMGTKIDFDWKVAELSLLQHKNIMKEGVLESITKLQQLYSSKNIPAFYSYYTLLSFLQRNIDVGREVEEEIVKTQNLQNNYQNIAVLLMMRRNLMEKIGEGKQKVDEYVQKIRAATIASIIKVHQWEQSFSIAIDHPVFFLWEEDPFLLGLLNNGTEATMSQYDLKPAPNPLLLKINDHSLQQEPAIRECLNIINKQKARYLQFTLRRPAFARLKKQQRTTDLSQPFNRSRQLRRSPILSKRISSSLVRQLNNPPEISEKQLEVIKKYRSVLKLKKPQKKEHLKTSNSQQPSPLFDEKLRVRLEHLKEYAKNKGNESVKQVNLSSKLAKDQSPIKTIRFLMEKEINLKESPNNRTQNIFDSLNGLIKARQKVNNHKTQIDQKTHSKTKKSQEQRIAMITKQTQFLLQSRNKQYQDLKVKNQTLKNLKNELIQKVKSKSNLFKPQHTRIQSKTHDTLKLPFKQTQVSQNSQLKMKISQKKRSLQQQKQQVIQQQLSINQFIATQEYQLIKKEEIVEKTELQLSLRKIKIEQLQGQLKTVQQKSQDTIQENIAVEIEKLKQKKQIQYELQKQRIKDTQNALQAKVKMQTQKQQKLQEQKKKKEEELRTQFQTQLSRIRIEHQREQAEAVQKLNQERQKKALFQQRLRQQNERLEKMQAQLLNYQKKQRELQQQLQQQQARKKQKQQSIRQQRQLKLQAQLLQLQQQQLQFLSKYSSANKSLQLQLQQLRVRNTQLQQSLACDTL